MNNQESPDITKARQLLSKFERTQDQKKRIGYFEEAIELLSQYAEDDSDEGRIAQNIQRTYTRKLLEGLPPPGTIGIDEWFCYFVILDSKMKKYVEVLCTDHPVLKAKCSSFIRIRASEAIAILSRCGIIANG